MARVSRERPAITGLGAWTALGSDVASLWSGLTRAQTALRVRAGLGDEAAAVRFPVGAIDVDDDGRPRALRFAIHAARAAIEDAGWDLARRQDPATALVVATTKGTIDVLQENMQGARPDAELPRSLLYVLAAELARELGLRGPVQTVSVACASGLAALGAAAHLLRHGDAARALVVGADALTDFIYRGFTALRALDPAGARPFDRDRAGLSVGEGAVAITLESDRPGSVVVLGYGASNDANHITGPARDGRGLRAALQASLRDADPRAVAFAIAHGTGTPYNDAMEGRAFAAVVPRAPVTGVKGAVGHMMGAAGLVNLAVAVRGLQAGACPPICGLEAPDPEIALDLVQGPPRPVAGDTAIVSASGFAGVNAAVSLARSKPAPARRSVEARGDTPSAAEVPRGLPEAREAHVLAVVELPPERAPCIAHVGARTARRLDDLCLFGLAAAEAALDAAFDGAGLDPARLAEAPHGLVLGTGVGCLQSDRAFYAQELRADGPPGNPRIFAYTLPNIVLGELAIRRGLTGENLVVSAADSAGVFALIEAAARVASGAWTYALALWVEAPGEGESEGLGPSPRAAAVVLGPPPDGTASRGGPDRALGSDRPARVTGALGPPASSSAGSASHGAEAWRALTSALRAGADLDLHVRDPSGYEGTVQVRSS